MFSFAIEIKSQEHARFVPYTPDWKAVALLLNHHFCCIILFLISCFVHNPIVTLYLIMFIIENKHCIYAIQILIMIMLVIVKVVNILLQIL